MSKSLVEKFEEKINNDYEKFIEKIKKLGPDEIIDNAYEISIKQIIKEIMEDKYFTSDEIKLFLKCGNIIEVCYDKWIDMTEDFGDIIESAIDKKIEELEDEEEELKSMGAL